MGSAIILCLANVATKYRFFHVARSNFLQELEKQLGVTPFPVETTATKDHLVKNNVMEESFLKNRLLKFLLRGRAAVNLIYLIFILGVSLGVVAIILSVILPVLHLDP